MDDFELIHSKLEGLVLEANFQTDTILANFLGKSQRTADFPQNNMYHITWEFTASKLRVKKTWRRNERRQRFKEVPKKDREYSRQVRSQLAIALVHYKVYGRGEMRFVQFFTKVKEMEDRTELRRDLHELQNLRSIASRQLVKNILDEKINEFENKIKLLESMNSVDGCGDVPSVKQSKTEAVSSNIVPLATVKITNYAWDQSDKYVKLYLTIPDIHTVPQEQIAVTFAESEVEVNAHDVSSKNYSLIIKGLLKAINPSSSSFKQKTNLLLIMMRKIEEENWKYLTKAEMQSKEKSTPKFDQKADPQESLMSLMKQLYDEGDDDMKRTICKAWHESQTKRNAGPEEPM
uniref:Calcyclin-binding protein n=1 Tax=Setaria digitata TaxID=48799 RepID=A0A915Q1U6_9BILA